RRPSGREVPRGQAGRAVYDEGRARAVVHRGSVRPVSVPRARRLARGFSAVARWAPTHRARGAIEIKPRASLRARGTFFCVTPASPWVLWGKGPVGPPGEVSVFHSPATVPCASTREHPPRRPHVPLPLAAVSARAPVGIVPRTGPVRRGAARHRAA